MKNDYKTFLKGYEPEIFGMRNLRASAVLIPIVKIDGEDHILFQVRSSSLRNQPGDIAFPGGRVDKGEEPRQAVIREFAEEIGEENARTLEVIGEFDTYISSSRGLIYSFVGHLDKVDLSISNDEVDKLFTVPISFLKENEPREYTNIIHTDPPEDFPYKEMGISEDYIWGKQKSRIYFYKYKDYVIWGITANILHNFISKIM